MTLIDTGPLVALCDPHDSRHRTASKHLKALAKADFRLCEAVLVETCFHLPRRAQRQRLWAVIDELDIEPLPDGGDLDFWMEVLGWLVKYADHEPDWADASIAVLSGRDAKLKVWTYDREFRTIWRRPNGTPIPMAVQ
ncbi:MAG: PIN domain-containing protein [Luteitalea sp.]|nr:PIN domain-containing protein [Luteitalea sp.]